MFLGHDWHSLINPWALHDRRYQARRDGFLATNAANLVFNVETEALRFQTGPRAVRLASLSLRTIWAGSAAGNLYIRAGGGFLEEYHTQYTIDNEFAEHQFPLFAVVPAYSLCVISFLNLTDSTNDRMTVTTVTGWLIDPKEDPL